MGGLAIKNAFTRRISRDEMFERYDAIVAEFLPGTDIRMPKFFNDKADFGDIDVLVPSSAVHNIDIRQFILDRFQSKEIVHNSNVWSFEFREAQVDFIIMADDNIDAAFNYFSYNDMGNLMGRIAHKFDTKYGQDGLRYVFRGEGKVLGEITLSKDPGEISKFLGLPVSYAERDFQSLDDIFEYVRSSRYFNPFMYDMDQLNKINRDRNKKRKTYQEFLKYCDELKKSDVVWYRFNPDKKVYLGYIEAHFPGFMAKYLALQDKEELRQAARSVFNGDMVIEKYGITGPALGTVMDAFRNGMNNDEFADYVLRLGEENVWVEFENNVLKVLQL